MLEKIDLGIKLDKKTFKQVMPILEDRLYQVQKTSWDAGVPVVILFEGWDAAGKGTSIQKLTAAMDPRGFKLYPIRAVRTHEKKYPWLWRFWSKIPARGEWSIFDRSWYGRVLVERVENLIPENEWRRGYRDIQEFERTLVDDGTQIIKFFLHISKQEQKRRFERLAKDPLTAWHVSPEDWEHYRRYDDWLLAYEEAFERTDTEWSPWTIVEATDRRHTWVKIYQTVIDVVGNQLGILFEPLPEPGSDVEPVPAAESEHDDGLDLEPTGEDSDDESPLGLENHPSEMEMPEDLPEATSVDEWALEEPGP